MTARGLCSICGKKPLYRDERCTFHYLKKHLRRRNLGKLPDALLFELGRQLRVERVHWRRYWAARKDLL